VIQHEIAEYNDTMATQRRDPIRSYCGRGYA
jgi:hypothetical protein